MSDGRGVLREVAWRELFPWVLLFRSFRLALHPAILAVSLIGALLTPLGWMLSERLFRVNQDSILSEQEAAQAQNGKVDPGRIEANAYLLFDADAQTRLPGEGRPFFSNPLDRLERENWRTSSPIIYVYERFSTPILRIYRSETTLRGFAFYTFGVLWTLAVWSFGGGMITRMAAIELGREEQASLRGAFRLTLRRWFDYFTAPLYPVLGTLIMAILCLPVGWLLYSSDVGVIVGGLLWIFVIIAGAISALLLLWLFIGWPLMWPAISAEETGDSFEAMSRSFAYSFQRPLHYLFYVVLAVVFGLVCWAVVDFVCLLTLKAAHWGVSWGSWHERIYEIESLQKPEEGVTALWAGVQMIRGIESILLALSDAFAFSFFFVASTAIYLLLRHNLDRAEFDDVWLEEDAPRFPVPPAAKDNEPTVSPPNTGVETTVPTPAAEPAPMETNQTE